MSKGLKLVSVLLLLIFLTSCGNSNPWQRSPQERREKPGTLIANVSKTEMQSFLVSNGLRGRIISEESGVFEIDAIGSQHLQKKFPEAVILQDKRVQLFALAPEPVIVSMTPEEALKMNRQQLEYIGLAEAQKKSLGEKVTVAVIDSGVNENRWELKPNMWVNSGEKPDNGVDDDGNGYVDDIHGWNFNDKNNKLIEALPHGTMSASLIASSLTGIAPKARIMGLRVSDEHGGAHYADILEAFQYAFENGADIINISMSGLRVSEEVLKIIDLLNKNDIFVSMSAGNSISPCEDNPYGTAFSKLPNALVVGALNLSPVDLQMAFYSNFGACVDVAAPAGVGNKHKDPYFRGIVTSYPFDQKQYYLYHGTSAAAPVVAGVAALVKALHPEMTGSELAAHLLRSATLKESLKEKVRDGAVINAAAAVK